LGPGTVVYGPRNIPHTWRSVGEGLNRATVISVPANFGVFFGRCAEAFAKGEPDMAEVMRIADEHGLLFVSPEQAAVYPEPTDPNVPPTKDRETRRRLAHRQQRRAWSGHSDVG
jgi:hypothetical protein